ncbi:uncharacterized protein [Atheta coriaria]|uniref:uncharacterized protein n=1 Tax=Dalotia coriaria TaxID=877792 RepID=UPI0031F3DAB8
MSDSDSDDGFANLITNSEENFWKTYQTAPKVEEPSKPLNFYKTNDNSVNTPSTSGTSSNISKTVSDNTTNVSSSGDLNSFKPQNNKRLSTSPAGEIHEAKQQKIQNESAHTSEDDSPKASSSARTTKRNLLSSILVTLSKPMDCTPDTTESLETTNEQPSNTSKKIGRRKKATKSTRKQPKRGAQTPQQPTTSLLSIPSPNSIDTNNFETQIDDPSKTPPREPRTETYSNRIMNVKVLWKSLYLKIFKIKRFTPLQRIIDHFATAENVDPKHICFSINDKIINLSQHSCVTLKYKPHEEIEGGVLDSDGPQTKFSTKEEHGVKLKVRLNKQSELIILPEDILSEHLYAQVVIKFGIDFGRFKLEFDGEIINFSDTIKETGLESGDCIDILL